MVKKNIAFVIYSLDSGGAERVVATLANALSTYYNVTIITLVNGESIYPLNDSVKILYCMDTIPNKINAIVSLKNNCRLYSSLKSVLKKQSIELTLSFMTTSNVLAILASKSIGIPCVISERSNPYVYTHNIIWNQLIKWTFPKSNYLVVQSQLVKDYYKALMPSNKIVILPNPLSNELVKLKNQLIERKNIILNVGRLDENKAQDLLIKAFSNLPNDDWELFFVGDGPLLATYSTLVHQLGVSEKIKFIGKTNDVSIYYNQSKIFAFTSKSEGFPNALIEAMFFEMPCISTDCPSGPSELIVDGLNGYLIPVNDQIVLERQLLKLMKDSDLCKTFGNNAFKTASMYEASYVVNQWKHLIDDAI